MGQLSKKVEGGGWGRGKKGRKQFRTRNLFALAPFSKRVLNAKNSRLAHMDTLATQATYRMV